jgi:hypothetical protein
MALNPALGTEAALNLVALIAGPVVALMGV